MSCSIPHFFDYFYFDSKNIPILIIIIIYFLFIFFCSRLGLSESLFHRLDHPDVTTTLHLQYRMNSEIMKFANAFAYQDQLKCGSDDVNSATIQIDDSSAVS